MSVITVHTHAEPPQQRQPTRASLITALRAQQELSTHHNHTTHHAYQDTGTRNARHNASAPPDARARDPHIRAALARIGAHPDHAANTHAIRRALSRRQLALTAWVAIAAAAGAAAAWTGTAIGHANNPRDAAELNALFFIAATLGPHTIFLILSVALTATSLIRTHSALAAEAATWFIPKRSTTAHALTALHARASGIWRNALVSQCGGLAFALGALAAFVIATALRERYDFFWKTTLLTPQQITALFDALFAPLETIGVATPSQSEITAAGTATNANQPTPAQSASPDTARRWAAALLAAIAFYAVAPRLILLTIAATAVTIADRAFTRRTLRQLGSRALEAQAQHARRTAGTAPTTPAPDAEPDPTAAHDDTRPAAQPLAVLLDIDTERAATIREKLDPSITTDAASRHDDRQRITAALANAPTRPAHLAVFASIGETPTATTNRFLAKLARAAGTAPTLVLIPGRSFALDAPADAQRAQRREQLWRTTANHANIPPHAVRTLDPNAALPQHWQHLNNAITQPNATAPHTLDHPALRRAMQLTATAFQHTPPDDRAMLALFADIDTAFQHQPTTRPTSLPSPVDIRAAITERADDIARILPAWTPRNPRWMAAGAAAATIGTLASLTAIAGPAALAAAYPLWPLYSAAGATIGECIGRAAPTSSTHIEQPHIDDTTTKLRAAALHAASRYTALLPRHHAARSVEAAFAAANDPDPANPRNWCDTFAHSLIEHAANSQPKQPEHKDTP